MRDLEDTVAKIIYHEWEKQHIRSYVPSDPVGDTGFDQYALDTLNKIDRATSEAWVDGNSQDELLAATLKRL
jgi:hypothetical protein